MVRAGGPVIRLGTKFSSIDEFVTRFAPFVTATTLLMPAVPNVGAGSEGRFEITLGDRIVALSGRFAVDEIKGAVGGRPVMRLRLLAIDEACRKVHERLLASKKVPPPFPAAGAPKPPRLPQVGAAPAANPQAEDAAPSPIAEGAESAIEATEKSRWLAAESRAPGAAFTLPANPLSALDAGDLASFIECTLFEADATTPAEPPDEPKTAGPVELEAADEIGGAGPPPGPPAEVTAPPPPMARAASPAEPPLSPARPGDASPPAPLRRALTHAAPYALCTILGVLVGHGIRRAPTAAPAPVASETPKPAAPEPRAPAAPPSSVPAQLPTAAERGALPTGTAAPPTTSGCLATITTEPPDISVTWGTRELGRTPLDGVAVDCGEAAVTLRHERYRDFRRTITATPGEVARLSERMRRPPATLVLSSSPAHAAFTINQERVQAGGPFNVMRFEHVRIEASLPGHRPWSQTLYVKEPRTRVVAQLVAIPKPKGAARAPAAARGDAAQRIDPFSASASGRPKPR